MCSAAHHEILPTREEFERYVAQQQEGSFNMFDPNARLRTGLSKDVYLTCMKHYKTCCLKYKMGKCYEEEEPN